MAKVKKQFVCRECGAVQPRWVGKCPDCGAWDALEDFVPADKSAQIDPHGAVALTGPGSGGEAVRIGDVDQDADTNVTRLSTGISELDRVLGGVTDETGRPVDGDNDAAGLVPGSAVMLGGDPGIGKSTLMLQAAHSLARSGRRVLYVTSEESLHQLRMRSERLNDAPNGETPDSLYVLSDTNLARILEQARKIEPDVLVIDSIQMIYKGDVAAAPGSVTQLRTCSLELVYFAKASGCALVLVGHVTKQGVLAGPRLLEHMVDAVLYFEGDRYHSHRVVRGIKNRFGTTLEVGLFEMGEKGLQEVADGRGLLAAEYQNRPGSVVCPVLQGTRCLLVELQALTATGFLGSVKRKANGVDANRLAVLIAVLEKRGGLRLADQDVFTSSVGGMKITEPAADLALAIAIAGAHYSRQLGEGFCAVGEIGLGGEVRYAQQMERRIAEASRLGFDKIICPAGINLRPPKGVKLIAVRTLDEALGHLN